MENIIESSSESISIENMMADIETLLTTSNSHSTEPKDLKSSLKKFKNSKKTSIKAENFKKKIEDFTLKVIRVILKHKQIKDGKIIYNIQNEGLIRLRKCLESTILIEKEVLGRIVKSIKEENKTNSKRNFFFSESKDLIHIFFIVVDLIFHSNDVSDDKLIVPSELTKKLNIFCCDGKHDDRCIEKWRDLKIALKNIGRSVDRDRRQDETMDVTRDETRDQGMDQGMGEDNDEIEFLDCNLEL